VQVLLVEFGANSFIEVAMRAYATPTFWRVN